ncbi:T9SS type A sorting domain-containing protein [Flavobacterium cellulosilyticum]|uniref:T9SS type A sorting domain-containing protein n=1 Tax=Flavobacterium cellulosilyticum TaxID=2541731 RepID=A0A4R5CJ20_9FLAO|nr:T9SS type A sorting domain-containing protein [Flavobacterium cellulosilyticum]TDD97344.1 T9SS type A sorting domain-containing protein [Flavobacterium cellulosilyticum]
MKRITFFLILFMSTIGFSQQKTTGDVVFLANLSAKLTLNNSNSTATLTIKGPSDRWFAITIGVFANGGAMDAGNDVVYFNGTTLIDATHDGQGNTPIVDAINNWTVSSNSILSGTRTIIATRPFVAEVNDYTFNYSDNSISLAGAHANSAISSSLQYHGNNRFNAGTISLNTLGLADTSLSATQIYPNPNTGEFIIKTNTNLEKINIYTQTGAFIKTIVVKNNDQNVEVNLDRMQTGVYLIQLVNRNEKTWKKIVVSN